MTSPEREERAEAADKAPPSERRRKASQRERRTPEGGFSAFCVLSFLPLRCRGLLPRRRCGTAVVRLHEFFPRGESPAPLPEAFCRGDAAEQTLPVCMRFSCAGPRRHRAAISPGSGAFCGNPSLRSLNLRIFVRTVRRQCFFYMPRSFAPQDIDRRKEE